MANLNKCSFIGTLGKDPEVKFLPSGDAMCNVSIAINSKWKDKKTNEDKESVEWIPLDFFGKLAEVVGKYVVKGQQIYVEGQYKTRKYQSDKDPGVDKYATSIRVDTMQMLGGKSDSSPSEKVARNETHLAKSDAVDNGDDIPF